VLSDTFPKQNDFYVTDYIEECNELLDFGIDTKAKLEDLIAKHKKRVLEIDKSELSDLDIKMLSEDHGVDFVQERIKNKYWFSYSGLLRLILELEFGEKYNEYAYKRDNV
jgi:hypothetical protein